MAAVQPALQLLADGLGAGRRLGVDQLRDERRARLVRPRGPRDRLLPVDAAPLREPVPAVRVDDAVLRQVPQPQVERHVRLLQVLGQPLVGLDEHVLNDVGGVHAARDGRVEPQVDDAAERFAELVEQADRPRPARPLRASSSSRSVSSRLGHMPEL